MSLQRLTVAAEAFFDQELLAQAAPAPGDLAAVVERERAEAARAIENGTGEVMTLVTPRRFHSVGEWYAGFGQLTEADVLTLLSPGGKPPVPPDVRPGQA